MSSTALPTDFLPTQWTLILSAGTTDTRAHRALEHLAGAYWYPLYAYIRRRGHSAADAEDLTQEFFSQFIEKRFLTSVDPAKGRFRAFLLACLNHFLSNQRDKARSQKRGGTEKLLSLETAEARYAAEPALTPERLFERRWALALLERVLERLRSDHDKSGQLPLFLALRPTLTDADAPPYATIAASLGMTEPAIKTAAHRLRRRYRDCLKQEIAQTVASPEQVAEEIAYLMKCL